MPYELSLTDKVAIVTGGSRGIGRAIALGLAQAGADVVLTSRHQEGVDEVAEEVRGLGRRALALAADVSNAGGVQRMVDATLGEFGRIDVLVCNAGISPVYKRAEHTAEDEWDAVIAVNLKGVFLCCQAAGKVMIRQKRGKIVNMGSVGGRVALTRLIAYCAAKGGVEQITKVLATEWAQHNIQVNALAPGFVETELTRGMRENPRLYEDIVNKTPAGRLAEPEDLVGAAVFLASDASDYITGHTLVIDGGWTAR